MHGLNIVTSLQNDSEACLIFFFVEGRGVDFFFLSLLRDRERDSNRARERERERERESERERKREKEEDEDEESFFFGVSTTKIYKAPLPSPPLHSFCWIASMNCTAKQRTKITTR